MAVSAKEPKRYFIMPAISSLVCIVGGALHAFKHWTDYLLIAIGICGCIYWAIRYRQERKS